MDGAMEDVLAQPLRYLHVCPDCYRLERYLPGGIRTR